MLRFLQLMVDYLCSSKAPLKYHSHILNRRMCVTNTLGDQNIASKMWRIFRRSAIFLAAIILSRHNNNIIRHICIN